MAENLALFLLRQDLEIMTHQRDKYLTTLLSAAAKLIMEEGIKLTDSEEDIVLQEQYAAYLYRKRKGEDTGMPRMLRWGLNQRLFAQRMKPEGGESGGMILPTWCTSSTARPMPRTLTIWATRNPLKKCSASMLR